MMELKFYYIDIKIIISIIFYSKVRLERYSNEFKTSYHVSIFFEEAVLMIVDWIAASKMVQLFIASKTLYGSDIDI